MCVCVCMGLCLFYCLFFVYYLQASKLTADQLYTVQQEQVAKINSGQFDDEFARNAELVMCQCYTIVKEKIATGESKYERTLLNKAKKDAK